LEKRTAGDPPASSKHWKPNLILTAKERQRARKITALPNLGKTKNIIS